MLIISKAYELIRNCCKRKKPSRQALAMSEQEMDEMLNQILVTSRQEVNEMFAQSRDRLKQAIARADLALLPQQEKLENQRTRSHRPVKEIQPPTRFSHRISAQKRNQAGQTDTIVRHAKSPVTGEELVIRRIKKRIA
jgi:septal ring factor EnvC (AmiA/AmiB activator)